MEEHVRCSTRRTSRRRSSRSTRACRCSSSIPTATRWRRRRGCRRATRTATRYAGGAPGRKCARRRPLPRARPVGGALPPRRRRGGRGRRLGGVVPSSTRRCSGGADARARRAGAPEAAAAHMYHTQLLAQLASLVLSGVRLLAAADVHACDLPTSQSSASRSLCCATTTNSTRSKRATRTASTSARSALSSIGRCCPTRSSSSRRRRTLSTTTRSSPSPSRTLGRATRCSRRRTTAAAATCCARRRTSTRRCSTTTSRASSTGARAASHRWRRGTTDPPRRGRRPPTRTTFSSTECSDRQLAARAAAAARACCPGVRLLARRPPRGAPPRQALARPRRRPPGRRPPDRRAPRSRSRTLGGGRRQGRPGRADAPRRRRRRARPRRRRRPVGLLRRRRRTGERLSLGGGRPPGGPFAAAAALSQVHVDVSHRHAIVAILHRRSAPSSPPPRASRRSRARFAHAPGGDSPEHRADLARVRDAARAPRTAAPRRTATSRRTKRKAASSNGSRGAAELCSDLAQREVLRHYAALLATQPRRSRWRSRRCRPAGCARPTRRRARSPSTPPPPRAASRSDCRLDAQLRCCEATHAVAGDHQLPQLAAVLIASAALYAPSAPPSPGARREGGLRAAVAT